VSAPAVTRPRLGFLGVGWIGRHRLDAVAASGAAEVVAVADAAGDAAAQAAATVGAASSGSLHELLEHDLDGVVIATPNAFHAEQSIAALERGLAVFCQKPLGRNAAETKRVVDAARAADRLLGVDLSYRHAEAAATVRELVRSGELGRITAVDLVFHNAYGPDKAWFSDAELAGGGCLLDLGIHLVDMALWTLDWPEFRCLAAHFLPNRASNSLLLGAGVEEYAAAQLELGDGVPGRLACSWHLPAGREAVIEVSFYGTEGGASWRNVGGSFYDFRAERFRGTQAETLVEPRDDWGGRAAVRWAERLAAGARFDSEAERLVDLAAALDAIYREGRCASS
jgi:predicted dehydrogenase